MGWKDFIPFFRQMLFVRVNWDETALPPTCCCRMGDWFAPLQTPLCRQSHAVAHSRSQVGHDVRGCRGRDHVLLDLAVPGDVHQPVGAELGLRFLPPQGEGRLRGLHLLHVCGRVDFWGDRVVFLSLFSISGRECGGGSHQFQRWW